ncbi:hypothetical protein BJ912DRAFT_1019921 [Pholiota molesta]|nr:hypothetical protein BJ912DRAFT_1019921 [Pholiota molesta]
MAPRILICSQIVWAHDDVKRLLGDIAEVVYVNSPDRRSFLAEFGPGGKYENTVGIYRENESAKQLGRTMGLAMTQWTCMLAKPAVCIYLSNTPGAVDDATATTALYLVISTLRHPKHKQETHDVTDKTLAILGLGGIGTRLAVLAHAFPMRNVDEMLAQTDVLSVHVPLRQDTMIRALKPGAIIVNTARGKVIDEEAMIKALEDGHLDTLPHMGTENQDTQRKMEVRALSNLRDFLITGKGKDLVPEFKNDSAKVKQKL